MSQSELFDNSTDGEDETTSSAQSEVERWARRSGHQLILGIDEAGRGPLAGPVYVGCVALDLASMPAWRTSVADSKQLTLEQRESAFDAIRNDSLTWSIQTGSPSDIDQYNILQATRRTMARAAHSVAASLSRAPDAVYIDGDSTVDIEFPQYTVVDGDTRSLAIAAASILAKVARDRFMIEQHDHWPEYGFDSHKGYPTQQHLDALRTHGPTPLHRRSFSPVREAVEASSLAE